MRSLKCTGLLALLVLSCSTTPSDPTQGYNLQQAAVSPDGLQIAFNLFDGIWIMSADGGIARQITAGRQSDDLPQWIPGRAGMLSYRSRRNGGYGLYVVNTATGEEQVVPEIRHNFNAYDWLPDGRRLVYAAGDRIFLLHMGTGQTSTVVGKAAGPVMSIDCSPDGELLAYDVRYFVGYQERLGEMHVVSLADGESVLLTGRAQEHFSPAWSPDGRSIAFVHYGAGTEDVYVCDFDPDSRTTGELRRVTDDRREESFPAWMPDGSALLVQANRYGRSALFRVPATGGEMRLIPVAGLEFKGATGRLHVTLNDPDTGDLVPGRVYLHTADSRTYYPPGAFPRENLKGDRSRFFHTGGEFELELPVGDVEVEVTRGPEYVLESRTVNITDGQVTEHSFDLERWVDMAAGGWYSADNHFHANYGGPFFMTPESVLRMIEAEDLNIANLVAGNSWAARLYDREFFTGGLHPLSREHYLIHWNQEYRSSAYGHLILMNVQELVAPYLTGFALSENPEDYPPNLDIIKAAQEQGGTAHYTHPQNGPDPFAGDYNAYELPVDLVLGRLDAMDIACYWSDELSSTGLYYRLLNCGFRMAASAGTDVFTSRINPPPGGERVYAHAGEPFTFETWMAAFKAGKTFVTNGPMLEFNVNGREPGSEILFATAGEAQVTASVTAQFRAPVDRLELVLNGEVVETLDVKDGSTEAVLTAKMPVTGSCWIAARALGPRSHLVMDSYTFAHTTPVYVTVAGQRVSSPEDARFFVKWIDEVLRRVDERDRWTRPEHKTRIHQLFRQAREYYSSMAGQPPA